MLFKLKISNYFDNSNQLLRFLIFDFNNKEIIFSEFYKMPRFIFSGVIIIWIQNF